MEEKSGIRIASFNIQKFSTISVMTKSNGETKKDLDTIGRIIRENQLDSSNLITDLAVST